MDKNRVAVGIDLCEDFTQLAFFDEERKEPVSVNREKEDDLVPTRLALLKEKHEWIIGEEVEEGIKNGEPLFEVKRLVERLKSGEDLVLGDTTYTPGHLLQLFLRRALFLLNRFYPYETLSILAITTAKTDSIPEAVMREAMERLRLEDRYVVLDHEEAFFTYSFHQKKEYGVNDSAIFELNEEGMQLRILETDEESVPAVAKIEKRYISKNLKRSMLGKNRKTAETIFENLALMVLEGNYVSTIYAVGRGFSDDWADEVLKKLSPGRRVFRGQNLYVKGACFFAKDKAEGKKKGILFLDEEKTGAGIYVTAVKDGKEREAELLSPDLKWREAEMRADLILKGEEELCLVMRDYRSKKENRRFLSFSGLFTGETFCTRIRLHLRFKDRNTCIIKASDLGFGEFVPTTNRVWELTWEK